MMKSLSLPHARPFPGPGKAYILFLVARFSTVQDSLNLMAKRKTVQKASGEKMRTNPDECHTV